MSKKHPHSNARQGIRFWALGLMVSVSLALVACQGTLALNPQTPAWVASATPNMPMADLVGSGIEGTAIRPERVGDESGLIHQTVKKTPAQYTDLWQRIRAEMKLPTLGDGAAAQKLLQHQRWYESNDKHLARVFMRAQRYLFDIVEQVEAQGLPAEIALLPAVESAFMPSAHSSAAADGLWQFIAPTGRRFDLKQHMFQDDRRNVRAATQAALRYLTELQTRYNGDYQLALAAYNCGEGCIDAAIRRARAKGLEGRFEDLELNKETANYVPRLLALTQLIARKVDEGQSSELPTMTNAPYYTAVSISRDIDIKRAAEFAGLTVTEFKELNPQHKKPVIVAASNAQVLVPVKQEEVFREAMARYRGPLSTWSTTTVSKRMPIEVLALQHGVTPASLRDVNTIPKGHLVAAGSTIVIPRAMPGHDIPAMVAENATLATVPAMVRAKVNIHKKENWTALAQRLGVKVVQLQAWNPGVKRLRAGSLALTLPIDLAERVQSLAPVIKATSRSVGRVKQG